MKLAFLFYTYQDKSELIGCFDSEEKAKEYLSEMTSLHGYHVDEFDKKKHFFIDTGMLNEPYTR